MQMQPLGRTYGENFGKFGGITGTLSLAPPVIRKDRFLLSLICDQVKPNAGRMGLFTSLRIHSSRSSDHQ